MGGNLNSPHQIKVCHPERSEGSAFVIAFVFLSVIPEGNLLLPGASLSAPAYRPRRNRI
jgi:hypothetical protein